MFSSLITLRPVFYHSLRLTTASTRRLLLPQMQKSFFGTSERGTRPFHTSVQVNGNDSSKSLPSDDEDEDDHWQEYDDEMAYGYNYFDIGEQLHGDRTYEIVRKLGYGFWSNVWLASFHK
jgi:hypothetical protein